MSGAIAAPMLFTSVIPKSTTPPNVALVIAIGLAAFVAFVAFVAFLGALSNAAPAPVTVHWDCGGRVLPSSNGYLYWRSALEK